MAYPNIHHHHQQHQQQQHQHLYGSYAEPRISFSNDFAATKHEMMKYKEAPVSSDFEFGVKNYAMIPADQIFFEGVILPLKDNHNPTKKMATLREELSEDLELEDSSASGRKTKGSSSWWRERLGLGFVRSKKDQKRASFHHQ